MKLTTWTSVFASLALLCACGGGNEAAVSLDNCPQVATFERTSRFESGNGGAFGSVE